MRILFIGDVVGRSGRAAIAEHVPSLRKRLALDFVVANGENAAGGFGITEAICAGIPRTPARMRSRSATIPATSARRWCSSSARPQLHSPG